MFFFVILRENMKWKGWMDRNSLLNGMQKVWLQFNRSQRIIVLTFSFSVYKLLCKFDNMAFSSLIHQNPVTFSTSSQFVNKRKQFEWKSNDGRDVVSPLHVRMLFTCTKWLWSIVTTARQKATEFIYGTGIFVLKNQVFELFYVAYQIQKPHKTFNLTKSQTMFFLSLS